MTAQQQVQADITGIQSARVELNAASLTAGVTKAVHTALAKIDGTLHTTETAAQTWLTANPTPPLPSPPAPVPPPSTTTTSPYLLGRDVMGEL